MSPDRGPGPPGRRLLRVLLPPVFWLGVWALAARAAGSELLLPGPAAVWGAFVRLLPAAPFWRSVGASLLRVLAGLAWGTAAGALLGALTAAWAWADALFSPAVRVVRSTPVASFILLILLWASRTAVPAVVSGLMVLPVIWEAVRRGLASASPLLLEFARAYRFGRFKTLRLICLPAVLPHFIGGVHTALGLAWKAGVAAEVLCRPRLAVGSAIYNAKLTLETPELFAWTAAVAALSFTLEKGISALLRRKGERP